MQKNKIKSLIQITKNRKWQKFCTYGFTPSLSPKSGTVPDFAPHNNFGKQTRLNLLGTSLCSVQPS